MKCFLAILTVLAGVLPLTSVVWGWLSTRKTYRKLASDLDRIDAIIEAPDDEYPQGKSEAMTAVREPEFNWGRVMYTYEWAQRLVLKQALDDLKGPAWLAVAGVFLGMVAGVWSMWM
ncbi:hypothetical protein ABZ554_01150 [Streptomyces sp. NPDC020125]|uniref:hypothetical protein n=1 Tax=Streptomyces sp. NPDC020125 TaxID=3154593 RepID=UPI0033D3BD9D